MPHATPPAATELTPPPRVIGGRYRLEQPIGSGGMSVVWRAHDEVLDRIVAVKLLTQESDADFRSRLAAEARACGQLNTPSVAQVYDYGVADDTPYLVMEYVDGEPLSQRLGVDGKLSPLLAVAIAAQVAAALRIVHGQGLVHCDVKPDNVLFTLAGAKLVDFGISAAAGGPAAQAGGRVFGTPAYLAPERLTQPSVSPAVDVYALGVLLYRALAGKLPWSDEEIRRARRRPAAAPLPPVEDLPAGVAELITACLAEDPADRPTSAQLTNGLTEVLRKANGAGLAATAGTAMTPSRTAVGPSRAAVAVMHTAPIGSFKGVCSPRRRLAESGHTRTMGIAWQRPRQRLALLLAGGVLAAVALLVVAWTGSGGDRPLAAAAAVPHTCTANFAVMRDWGSGFQAKLTVVNTGPAAVRGWNVTFTFPGNQALAADAAGQHGVAATPSAGKAYTAVLTQSGRLVAARAASASQALAANHSVTFMVSAGYVGQNPIPTSVSLNGSACATQISGAASPITPTTKPANQGSRDGGGDGGDHHGGDDGGGHGHGHDGKHSGKD